MKLIARLCLLIAGLGHLLPGTLAPILTSGVGILTAQRVMGLASVILALYFLVKKVP